MTTQLGGRQTYYGSFLTVIDPSDAIFDESAEDDALATSSPDIVSADLVPIQKLPIQRKQTKSSSKQFAIKFTDNPTPLKGNVA